MAPRESRPRCSPHRNLLPFDLVDDELARDPGPVGSPHSRNTFSAPSCNPTLGPKLVLALILALIPALTPLFSNELFKQFMRAYLELNEEPKQPPAEREQFLKGKVPEVYYIKLHMDCYHFCQQCEDYFEIARATGAKRTPFVAFFFWRSISIQ